MTHPDARDEATSLPRHTTPTWEVELLISGVAVFAMLQLPELLDRYILDWTPRLVDRWAKLLFVIYVYAKSAAIILAVTFVIHLLLRARWIALVGMLSIYPKGVDWDHFKLGPNAREFESKRLGKMEDAIDRADNRATMVFAMGVVLASILCVVTLAAAVVLGIAWLLEARFGVRANSLWLMWTIAVAMVPYGLAMAIDRRAGARMAPDGIGTRVLRAVLGFYSKIGVGMANNPALALLSSHRGRRRTIALIASIFFIATFAASTSYYVARNPDAYGSYDAFPDEDELPSRSVDPAHYDDRRDPIRNAASPFIQSAVIIGPYVQLVVPWVPDRDGPALDKRCGTLPAERQLACYAEHVRPVTLDGKPIAPVFDIGEDARTNRPALVAMIDVRRLPQGRHVLGVTLPQHGPKDTAPDADFIPFWR
ncbi:hypothetical protein LF41_2875 [Lysobacter dokdonensis DS-58]|uniref:Transmembrane protein n=1 Tax=Lysobacter dokdonensis DS-58 TaxID=1300345 RepID=A0A0A2X204_9GAMM|nr:sulfite exporter TauE/SafE family protein [Lysobacter dokdonensis]KGQ19229.1 hypothetical protein LF41_2875 [Lysobacter dokdonensis DS-58]